MVRCLRCGGESPPGSRFCGSCGAALQPTYPTYGRIPPPGRDHVAVVVILVVVLVVAVPVVASAVLYVMVSGLLQPPAPSSGRPYVTLTLSSSTSIDARLLVAGCVPSTSPGGLRVNIEANSSYGTAVPFPTSPGTSALVHVPINAGDFQVQWSDADDNGLLSTGDQLTVTYPRTVPSGTLLQLFLVWSDGSTLVAVGWIV